MVFHYLCISLILVAVHITQSFNLPSFYQRVVKLQPINVRVKLFLCLSARQAVSVTPINII